MYTLYFSRSFKLKQIIGIVACVLYILRQIIKVIAIINYKNRVDEADIFITILQYNKKNKWRQHKYYDDHHYHTHH